MSDSLHHIRLVAGLEIGASIGPAARILERDAAETLGAALADDLLEQADAVSRCRMTLAGVLLEPGDLLRPGLPAWAALEDLGRTSGPFAPGVLSIGAHRGRLPRADLAPPARAPAGRFLCIPVLLTGPAEVVEALESELEKVLFERAGLRPPTLAALHQAAGVETVHGQLMTAYDLLALVRMQLAAAGLDPFWPPVEHAVLEPDRSETFALPGDLELSWNADGAWAEIPFRTFDRAGLPAADYPLWLRAFRQQTALLDLHSVNWRPRIGADETLGRDRMWLTEDAGADPGPDRLVRQLDPDLGLVALSERRGDRLRHHYPLKPGSGEVLEKELAAHGRPESRQPLCYDADLLKLRIDP